MVCRVRQIVIESLTHLVNTACILIKLVGDYPELVNRLISQSYEGAEDCFKVNYYGTKDVSEALIPFLWLSPTPKMINLSSVYGQLRVSYFVIVI